MYNKDFTSFVKPTLKYKEHIHMQELLKECTQE